ncbi:MAG: hypothetical protein IJX18_02655 [Clostridia bacterium]|nr:hypothetical protein [Clostridia bacterium]
MKGRIYAIILITAFFAGSVGVFFAASFTLEDTVNAVVGFVVSIAIVPIIHELGHVTTAKSKGMNVVYVKCFCLRFFKKGGKIHIRFASPMRADETRAIPKKGGDMQRRALAYISGGLVFSGVLALLLAGAAILLLCLKISSFTLWGMLPYALYLFLLNAIPVQYANGKTDALTYREVKKATVEGKALLNAMEIQGRLYAGERYSEIPVEFYETYALREDEPLFALLWEAKYHYYLEKNDLEKGADALNRLIASGDYLTDEMLLNVRVETAYMFLLQKDASELKRLQESDEEFLRSDDYRAKRLLATYAYACGEEARGEALVEQAKISLKKEEVQGLAKHELLLLERLQTNNGQRNDPN